MARKEVKGLPGRPSSFSKKIAKEVCDRLAAGESLRQICRDERLPGHHTIRRWAIEDREGFYAQYARAREIQAETFADEIVDISDDGTNDYMAKRDESGAIVGWRENGEYLARSRLRVDTRKWIMSRILPKKYGDKAPAAPETGTSGNAFEFTMTIDGANKQQIELKATQNATPADKMIEGEVLDFSPMGDDE